MSGGAWRIGVFLTPALAIAIALMVLGWHAPQPFVSATVTAAALPRDPARGFAWQVFVGQDDGTVLEPRARDVTVIARRGERSATWRGAANADGIAEAALALEGAPTWIEVSDASGVLASGDVAMQDARPAPAAAQPFLSWAMREGDVALDVAVEGYAAGAHATTRVWIRAKDRGKGTMLQDARIEATCDGAEPREQTAQTVSGWAPVFVRSASAGATLHLRATSAAKKTGEWSGLLPFDPQAARVELASPRVAPGGIATFSLRVPGAGRYAYLELDDAAGRLAAAAVPLAKIEDVGTATWDTPPLAEGLYWLVVSHDAHATSPARVVTFVVGAPDLSAIVKPEDCPPEGCATRIAPHPIPRWLALDGFQTKRAARLERHALGRTIAIGVLAIAAALEAVLVVLVVLDARRRMRAAEELRAVRGRFAIVSLLAGLMLAILGFAMLALIFSR